MWDFMTASDLHELCSTIRPSNQTALSDESEMMYQHCPFEFLAISVRLRLAQQAFSLTVAVLSYHAYIVIFAPVTSLQLRLVATLGT